MREEIVLVAVAVVVLLVGIKMAIALYRHFSEEHSRFKKALFR